MLEVCVFAKTLKPLTCFAFTGPEMVKTLAFAIVVANEFLRVEIR